jgi:hypothetical protein
MTAIPDHLGGEYPISKTVTAEDRAVYDRPHRAGRGWLHNVSSPVEAGSVCPVSRSLKRDSEAFSPLVWPRNEPYSQSKPLQVSLQMWTGILEVCYCPPVSQSARRDSEEEQVCN